jgi:hypothetical protein
MLKKFWGQERGWSNYVAIVALLCNDHELGDYIRPVSGQRLDKHVPAATGKMRCC